MFGRSPLPIYHVLERYFGRINITVFSRRLFTVPAPSAIHVRGFDLLVAGNRRQLLYQAVSQSPEGDRHAILRIPDREKLERTPATELSSRTKILGQRLSCVSPERGSEFCLVATNQI